MLADNVLAEIAGWNMFPRELRSHSPRRQGWTVFSIISVGHQGDVYVVYNKEK